MSEMVVFTQRENFDFLKFSSRCSERQKEALRDECVRVQETQKGTAQAFGVWALRLVDLRDTGVWEDVINPETGFAFFNEGFGAFCEYAFGLSKTMTSNLTKVAQFIINDGDEMGLLQEKYRGYDFSKLVELSSVATETHKFFKPTMTVEEIRTSKAYIKKSVEFRFEEKGADYDLLSKAQEWKGKDKKSEKPIEVIPGQINLDDISDSIEVEVHSIPTSELANAGEEEIDIYDMPMQTHSFDSDDYDEADEAYEDMQAEMQTIEQDSEKSLPQEEYDCCKVQKGVAPWLKPDFKNRDGIREFYQAYMSWEQLYCRVPCVEVYRYKFKIGTLYAVKGRVAGILEPRESREIKYSVRYFWQDKGDWLCCETSKFDLEKFIPLHKDEL